MTKIFLEFETKVDIKYDTKSQIVIPMVSLCKQTKNSFRNSSQQINGLSPAQIYNQTFNFNDIFIKLKYIRLNREFDQI